MSEATNAVMPAPEVTPQQISLGKEGGRVGIDSILGMLTTGAAVSVLLMLASLVLVLSISAVPSIRAFGASFLVGHDWRPNALPGEPKKDAAGNVVIEDGEVVTETIPPAFGALPVIFGTAVSSLLALVVAVPLSLGAAVFVVRVAKTWLAGPVSFLIEFLAAIPSLAYGLWGLFVLCPLLAGTLALPQYASWVKEVPVVRSLVHTQPQAVLGQVRSNELDTYFYDGDRDKPFVYINGIEPALNDVFKATPGLRWLAADQVSGRDMFAGGLILGIMIIPIITAISRDVLKQVPRQQLEGTVALGATWWESTKEMLKYSRSGLFGAIMLGLARAAGETMAITMVIGNNNQIKASLFAPAQTMSSLLANEFAEASTEVHRSALVEVALILLVMSLAFNIIARWLVVGGSSRTAAAH